MGENSNYGDNLVFAAFLNRLHQLGFAIGVGHYLRLQELLNRMGVCHPSELKTLLCPLFAVNRTQQEQFYRVFDEYFDLFQLTESEAEYANEATSVPEHSQQSVSSETKRVIRRRWFSLDLDSLTATLGTRSFQLVDAVVLLVILGASVTCISIYSKSRSELTSAIVRNQAAEDSVRTLTLKIESLEKTLSELRSDPIAIESLARERFGFVRPSDLTVRDPKQYSLLGAGLSQLDQLTAGISEGDPAPSDVPERSFYQRHFDLINRAIVLSPFFLFLILELYYLSKRSLVIQSQQGKRPPYVWPIGVATKTLDLWDSERFYNAARLMRRRQVAESSQLDLEATVAATIQSLGYPSLRFKPNSEQPEYVVLIERASYRDHQSLLFNDLVKKLEMEGVLILRYYYDDDPRLCCDDNGNAVYLADLCKHLSQHRLIVYGSGEDLVDPVSGKMLAWTNIFLDWQWRALLTPKSPSGWGINEINLANEFMLVPATLNGLLAVVEQLDSTISSSPGGGGEPFDLSTPGQDQRSLARALCDYLGEETFRWLCACAIYPEIQWDLTLHLALLPCMKEGIANEKNALRLFSLPWFRNGSIASEMRSVLIGELDNKSAKTIRSAIIELLERSVPPRGSFARDDYRLNLAAQRWLVWRNAKRRSELFKVIRSVPESRVLRDYALLRSLESADPSPLSLLLPRRIRKLFFRRGIRALGMRSLIRAVIAILLMFAAASTVRSISHSTATPIERQATVLARHESRPIEWLDDNALPMEIDLSTGSNGYIPPITTGFSRTKVSGADAIVNLERIQIYKQIRQALDHGPNARWNSIDEIDLTWTNDVILRLIDPPITIHVGDTQFRKRLETALLILEGMRRKDSQFIRSFHLDNPRAFLGNATHLDFMNIDVSEPERVVITFYSSANRHAVRNTRRPK